ncbi:MAG: lysophospholipase [Clostridia bacterium]|nr:lysophospholipase [Clostridia bacterium]
MDKNYKEITGYFTSSNQRDEVYYRICITNEMPKGIIQIAHGMCEYFNRYEGLVEYFTQRGFIVCGNDHIGHANSVKSREDLGYFGKEGYNTLTEDLKLLNDIVRKKYRSLPYILLGHSMGSFVVRDYITKHPDTVDGCIICGTSGTNKALSSGIMLCSVLSRIKGEKHRSKFMRNIAFSGYNSHFKSEKDEVSWLTRERDVRCEYTKDPDCGFTFTLNGYKSLFMLLKKVSEPEWEQRVPKSLPILLIAGEDDPVGDYGKGVLEVYDRLNQQEINMLRIKLYPGARHELFNERNREEVFSDVEEFAKDVIEGVLEARGYVRF